MHAGLPEPTTPVFERIARTLLGLSLMAGVAWALAQNGGLNGLVG